MFCLPKLSLPVEMLRSTTSARIARHAITRSNASKTPPTNKSKVPQMPSGHSTTNVVSPAAPSPPLQQIPLTPPAPTKVQTSPVGPSSSSDAPKAPIIVPPPIHSERPRHRFRNFAIGTTLISCVGFAAGTWYSTKNDSFQDFFTQYIPFGEDAVLYFEEMEFRRRFPDAGKRESHIGESAKVVIPRAGVQWKVTDARKESEDLEPRGPHMSAMDPPQVKAPPQKKESKQKQTLKPAKKPSEDKQSSGTTIQEKATSAKDSLVGVATTVKDEVLTEGEKIKKKVDDIGSKGEAEMKAARDHVKDALNPNNPKSDSSATESKLERADTNSTEPLIREMSGLLNAVIDSINASGMATSMSNAIEKAKAEIQAIAQNYKEKESRNRADLEQQLSQQAQTFNDRAKEQQDQMGEEMEIHRQQWAEQFQAERERIVELYNERLAAEMGRAIELAENRTKNELVEQAVNMKSRWIHELQQKVEEEREGRLGKIEQLQDEVDTLGKSFASVGSSLESNFNMQRLIVALDALRAIVEGDKKQSFQREIATLNSVSSQNDVVDVVVGSLPKETCSKGVQTTAALADRFENIAAQVRQTALLPDNAGVAGHASSWLLSKLLFRKKGLADGDDVESVLTRVETFLREGNLDDAAREANSLNGWAKVLTRDWLVETRKTLEVKQAIEVSW